MVTVLGNVFHSFGALYKKQLLHDHLDNVSRDLLATDAHVCMNLSM